MIDGFMRIKSPAERFCADTNKKNKKNKFFQKDVF